MFALHLNSGSSTRRDQAVNEVSISPTEWVAIGVGFFIVIIGLSQMPKYWRGELRDLHARGSAVWWPLGTSLRRGFLRTLHLGLAGATCALLTLVSSFIEQTSHSPAVTSAADAAKGAFIALFLCILLLDLAVVVANRPKILVPPPYRDDRGAVEEWAEQWRRRKRADD